MSSENKVYEVSRIMDHRCSSNRRQAKIEYKILWKGYSEKEASWEPEVNLVDCKELVFNYHKLHPELPPPFSQNMKNQFFDDTYQPYTLITHKKRGPGEGKPRGRPIKNLSKKIKEKQDHNKSEINQTKSDGFNIRMQNPEKSVVDSRGSADIKITKFHADPDTNQIYYTVLQKGHTSLKTRRWVLNRSKQALIQFYESMIVRKNNNT